MTDAEKPVPETDINETPPATAKPGDKGAADTWGKNPSLGNEINPSDVIKRQQEDAK